MIWPRLAKTGLTHSNKQNQSFAGGSFLCDLWTAVVEVPILVLGPKASHGYPPEYPVWNNQNCQLTWWCWKYAMPENSFKLTTHSWYPTSKVRIAILGPTPESFTNSFKSLGTLPPCNIQIAWAKSFKPCACFCIPSSRRCQRMLFSTLQLANQSTENYFLLTQGAAYFTRAASLVCLEQNKKHRIWKGNNSRGLGAMVVIQYCHAG